ncbi:prolyl 3-hydroxylase 2-like, partial [Sinocyclocheilus rhinocerous]|uniref:prolyl 3-hydroxylase 2-like n=1 Tax=Sinocyclocheilus rhinocerous TaxID=307959 RepID=UPI0007B82E0E
AVLYLNDDFEGGDFFFADRDAKHISFFFSQAMVKPKCGRLVGFTSGPVNPHGVTAVTAGRRCALTLWFTTEKHHRDMEREEAEELWAANGKSVVKEEKGEGESALKSARSGRSQGKERSKERERVTGRRDEL